MIDAQRRGRRRAGDPNILLVRRDRHLDQVQKVLQVGLGFRIALQLLDREVQPELVDARSVRAARAISPVRPVRAVRVDLRPQQGQDRLERVRDRELPRRPPVHVADGRPEAHAHELIRRRMLEQP